MNKKLGIKVLLQNPFAIIMDGVRAQEQGYFKRKTLATYGSTQLPTLDLLDLFPSFNETIDPYSFLSGTSLPTDLALLKLFARKFDNCAYLEIGSWRGESIANVSEVTTDCTSLTLSKSEMKAFNFSNAMINLHEIFSKHIPTIKKIEQNSRTYDFNKLNKKFDLIFIDGDHSYEGILNDTQKIFSLRKNDQSIIVWHDYSFDTEKVRYSTLKAILDGIPSDKHHNLYHISNTMCAAYIENMNLPTSFPGMPSYPTKKFSIKISAEKLSKTS